MLYISSDGKYPRHIGDVQLVKPGFQEGDELPEGWQKVAETERPTPGPNQVVLEGPPKDIDDVLSQNWVVRDLTQDEIEYQAAMKKLEASGLTTFEIDALLESIGSPRFGALGIAGS